MFKTKPEKERNQRTERDGRNQRTQLVKRRLHPFWVEIFTGGERADTNILPATPCVVLGSMDYLADFYFGV